MRTCQLLYVFPTKPTLSTLVWLQFASLLQSDHSNGCAAWTQRETAVTFLRAQRLMASLESESSNLSMFLSPDGLSN